LSEQLQVPHPPSIKRLDFNCPHCGAHSGQAWYTLAANELEDGTTPSIPDNKFVEEVKNDPKIEKEVKSHIVEWVNKINTGLVFLETEGSGHYLHSTVYNLHLSKCYSCKKLAVWVYDTLLFPKKEYVIPPNEDLPQDIRNDYEEASEISQRSPRGAAALLRLAIQKLCVHLGQPGKNINSDIATLVKQGLDIRVQQSLDVVRVVGNNAVHPGQIDMKDDRETTKMLFGLVNLIAEKMITEPKHVQAIFDSLPEDVRKTIQERDGK
jgi:hypothetical protein